VILFIQQIFGNGEVVEIPTHLLLRQNNLSHQVIPLVVLSFVIITFAKFQNHFIFNSLFKLIFANKNFEQVLKEDLKIASSGSVALIINYFLIVSTCVFLSIEAKINISTGKAIFISLGIPTAVFLFQIISLWLIGAVTKETKIITVPLLETTVIIEFIGFLLFFLALIWVLNPRYTDYFLFTFGFILCLGFLIRFFKSLYSVLRKGVSWYYIILYFCTLEILPFVIVYYYASKNFKEYF
jgi:hypothetical protein